MRILCCCVQSPCQPPSHLGFLRRKPRRSRATQEEGRHTLPLRAIRCLNRTTTFPAIGNLQATPPVAAVDGLGAAAAPSLHQSTTHTSSTTTISKHSIILPIKGSTTTPCTTIAIPMVAW